MYVQIVVNNCTKYNYTHMHTRLWLFFFTSINLHCEAFISLLVLPCSDWWWFISFLCPAAGSTRSSRWCGPHGICRWEGKNQNLAPHCFVPALKDVRHWDWIRVCYTFQPTSDNPVTFLFFNTVCSFQYVFYDLELGLNVVFKKKKKIIALPGLGLRILWI